MGCLQWGFEITGILTARYSNTETDNGTTEL